ncbi:uncharacterized protein LOC114916758 [Cajanus cajan]|uniref:uncharacterized protein LOC114916758 n=1 Tax=Cajanus cajan TaxID=3821 RepID=UPI0010FB651A|nr:uncharacterized protein LOC114916758 [Cajanus cajan]
MENKRQGKRKIHPFISIGSEGGIAGLLVFGGALAFAGFMAVASFASNKRKPKDHQPKPQQLLLEDHHIDTTQTLTSLIQDSTIPHGDATCCWTPNISVNQEEKSELKETSVEENPTQEIVFSDYSHPESAASSNESGVAEAQEVEKDEEPQHDITSSETEDEKDDVDDVSEKATGTTTLDHKEEPVWPAKHTHVCTDSDVDDSDCDDAKKATMCQNLNVLMVSNYQPLTWLFPFLLLALLLLLVLLTHRPQESFYVLDEANSVVNRI